MVFLSFEIDRTVEKIGKEKLVIFRFPTLYLIWFTHAMNSFFLFFGEFSYFVRFGKVRFKIAIEVGLC